MSRQRCESGEHSRDTGDRPISEGLRAAAPHPHPPPHPPPPLPPPPHPHWDEKPSLTVGAPPESHTKSGLTCQPFQQTTRLIDITAGRSGSTPINLSQLTAFHGCVITSHNNNNYYYYYCNYNPGNIYFKKKKHPRVPCGSKR